jgi:hypothetical protein
MNDWCVLRVFVIVPNVKGLFAYLLVFLAGNIQVDCTAGIKTYTELEVQFAILSHHYMCILVWQMTCLQKQIALSRQ